MGGHGHSSHRHGHHPKSSRNHSSGSHEWYGRESSLDLAPFQNTRSHHKKHRRFGSHDEYGSFDHDPMSEFLDYTNAGPSTGYSPYHPPIVMHNSRSHRQDRMPSNGNRPFKHFSEDAYLGAIPLEHDPYAKHDPYLEGIAEEQTGRTLRRSHFDESSHWSPLASHHPSGSHRRLRSYQKSPSPDRYSSTSKRDAHELGLDGSIGRYHYDNPMLSPYSHPAPSVGRRTPVPYLTSDQYRQRR